MHRISEFAVYLAAFADVLARRGKEREREREREKQGGLRERGKEKRGERVALFALCTEGGSKEEKERKLSAVIALVGVQIAPARKIIFKRPERGGYSAKVMGKR